MSDNKAAPDRVGSLDGIRGIAVVLTVAFHFKWPGFRNGHYGVDIFFVLSGFLISTILFTEVRATNGIAFGRFFQRRAARLLPASIAVLAVAVAPAVLGLYGDRTACIEQGAAALLYAHNYVSKAQPGLCGPIQHYWSLSVEEQFYLVVPFLVVARARSGRVSRGGGPFLVAVAMTAWNLWLASRPAIRGGVFELPYAGLLVGVALASFRATSPTRVPRLPLVGISLGAICVALAAPDRNHMSHRTSLLLTALVHLAVAVIVLWAVEHRDNRVLNVGVVRWLGTRSYGIYLTHIPIQGYLNHAGVQTSLAHLAATLVVAELSFRYFETPLRRRFSPRHAASPALFQTPVSIAV